MFRLISLAVISIISIYTIESVAVEHFITGKITYDGSKIINKNSKVEISLRDVSLMDVASKLISSTIISDAKTFPISYELKYNPSEIKRGLTYALSARITGPNNNLLFITDVRTVAQLIDNPSPTIDIPVVQIKEISSTNVAKRNDQNSACKPVKCPGKPKVCPYGYQKKDGCEICRCNDPCNPPGKPILCGPKKRCFIDKKSYGTFETRCGTVSLKQIKREKPTSIVNCNLPKVVGKCKASLPRFYYNSTTKQCESFDYGGCGGNTNKFKTKVHCEKTCKI